VRFTDDALTANDDGHDPNRSALLPYRDDPSPSYDHNNLPNDEIHQQHTQILREQDDQLDRLGESIGRQHQLSIQIGDELEDHVLLLDDLDGHVDRHTSTLDGARRRLGKFRRKAKESGGIMTIIGLIIVLVILIVILK
jgi:syntaxin 8